MHGTLAAIGLALVAGACSGQVPAPTPPPVPTISASQGGSEPSAAPSTATPGALASPEVDLADEDANISAASDFLVADRGGAAADFRVFASAIGRPEAVGNDIWAAKFSRDQISDLISVYRDAAGRIGGSELLEIHGRSDSAVPGRPYLPDASALLEALRTYPDAAPGEIATPDVAAAIAAELWTWDGQPYLFIDISTNCGPAACTFSFQGIPMLDTHGIDHYELTLNPATGVVTVDYAGLEAYPLRLDPSIDAAARAAVEAGLLRGMNFKGAWWTRPPHKTHYWTTYGGETQEGHPGVHITVDLVDGSLITTEKFTY